MRQVMPVNAFGTLAEVGAGMIVYFLVLLLSREELTQKALDTVRNRGGKEHA